MEMIELECKHCIPIGIIYPVGCQQGIWVKVDLIEYILGITDTEWE